MSTLFAQSGLVDDLTIDLGVVRYIYLDALVLFLGSIAERTASNLPTRLTPSRTPRVMNFLEAWRFFDTLKQWGENCTWSYFTPDLDQDLAVRAEARAEADRQRELAGHRLTPDDDLINPYLRAKLPRNSIPLLSVSLDNKKPLHVAAAERARWLDGPIQKILQEAIGKQASQYIAKAVIFEGIKNTAVHSGASRVYTTAQFQEGSDASSANEYVVCLWDDGDSIADTLRGGMEKHRSITTPAYGQLDQHFNVSVQPKHADAYNFVITSADDGELSAEDHPDQDLRLTIAAFFLGVSSDPRPRGADERPDPDIARHLTRQDLEGISGYGGVGTYLILDTVTYQCFGIVEYYNDRYHMTLTSTGEPNRYNVVVKTTPDGTAGVRGNLLVARVPAATPPFPAGKEEKE